MEKKYLYADDNWYGNGEMMFSSEELDQRGIGDHQRKIIRHAFEDGLIKIHASNKGWMYE